MHARDAHTVSVLIVDTNSKRSARLAAEIQSQQGLTLLGRRQALNAAYNETEAAQPDIVFLSEDQSERPEFPMFAAMLRQLSIRCVIQSDAAKPLINYCAGIECVNPCSDSTVDVALGLISKAGAAVPTGRRAIDLKGENSWKTVVIGSSTGGIEALLTILAEFPVAGPPTLIVQHIGDDYIRGVAHRLDRHCAAEVRLAEQNMPLLPGRVILAGGNGFHLRVGVSGKRCKLVAGNRVSGHMPSIDVLFESAAQLEENVVGVLLTGMGRDGAEGLLKIRKGGGFTIGQDRSTSTVFGMPRVAHELGAVTKQLPLEDIGAAVLSAAFKPGRAEKNAGL